MDLGSLKKRILKDPVLYDLSVLSKEKGVPFFLVGGYIRDLLLDENRLDYDFALPREASFFIPAIEEALRIRFFRVGKEALGTTTYRTIKKGTSIDITPFQGETIEADLRRRDFTMNAIAYCFLDETFHQVEGAFEDIAEKRIRPVSPLSLDQDPLRMLRAVRYLSSLKGFEMDRGLEEAISAKKEKIKKVPVERIKTELDRILESRRPGFGMSFLYDLGLLDTILPELKGLEKIGRNEYHHLNALSHTFLMIDKISWAFDWMEKNGKRIVLGPDDGLALHYAALFHDLGKQDTYSRTENGRVHFYHHESRSCERAEAIMERLKFSHSLKNKVLHLIKHHMRILNLSQEIKEGALKRLVNHIGEEMALLVLHSLADKEASRGILSIDIDEVVEGHCLRLIDLFEQKEIVHPPPLLTGHDVMALGYPSGPKVGEILNFIRERQVEGEIKTREEALKVLKESFGDQSLGPDY